MASGPVPQEAVVQSLRDLDRAEAYCRWLASFLSSHRGKRIVELGSGTGNLTRYLLEGTERAWLLEMDPRLCATLRSRFENGATQVIQVDLSDGLPLALVRSLQAEGVDTIASSNVLEHLPDDLGLLRQGLDLLAPGGRSMHIVPAHPWLFNRMDRAFGHLRRYTKRRVQAVVQQGGWAVERMQYINLSGTLGWVVGNRKGSALNPARVALFERYCLPVERILARKWMRMPSGLSLFFSLRKV